MSNSRQSLAVNGFGYLGAMSERYILSMKYFLTCLLIVLSLLTSAAIALPPDWRAPNESDMQGSWKEYGKILPEPYHLCADFNGDGLEDDIWILARSNNSGWGIFLSLGAKSGEKKLIKLREFSEGAIQDGGLLYINPGSFEKTACALNMMRCYPGDAYILKVRTPTFQYFKYAGGSYFFHWDYETHAFIEDTIED